MNKIDFFTLLEKDKHRDNFLTYDKILEFYNLIIKFLFFNYYYDELNEDNYNYKLIELQTFFNLNILKKLKNKINFEDLIQKILDLRPILDKDIDAIYQGDPACNNKYEIVLIYPGFKAIEAYRIAHIFYNLKEYFIARTISENAHTLTGIDINPGAQIGHSFFIDHGTGIVIGETTIIGNNVKLYQGVTLGALSLKEGRDLKNTKRHPTIEDNVTIYSGASIFGGQTIIGENSIIGSNVFITKSVPKNSLIKIKNCDIEKIINN